MPGDHLDPETLHQLSLRALPRARMLEAARHLARCSECRTLLGRTDGWGESPFPWQSGGAPAADEAFDSALDRVSRRLGHLDRLMTRERQEAPHLLARFDGVPHARRRLLVSNSQRFVSVGLAELLLVESRRHWSEDPVASEELAELALTILDRLAETEENPYGPALLNDLRGQAWSYVANARRIRSDLHRVEEAFTRARHHLSRGTGDATEEAQLLSLEASYLRTRRRYPEAENRLQRAAELHRATGDQHLEGRVLMSLALIRHNLGDVDGSIELLRQASPMIDAGREPRLLLALLSNLSLYLVETDRPQEAMALLPEVRALAKSLGGRHDRLRVLWVEGRVHQGMGHAVLAERALRKVLDAFVEDGMVFNAALVTFELAILYLEEGRQAETLALARDLTRVFSSLDLPQEVLATLAIFRQAAESDQTNRGLLRDLAARIRQAAG